MLPQHGRMRMNPINPVKFGAKPHRKGAPGRKAADMLGAVKRYCSGSAGRTMYYYGLTTAGAVGAFFLLDALTPLMIRLMPGRTYQPRTQRPDDPQKLQADSQRRARLTQYLYRNCLARGDHKIHWKDLPGFVDFAARLATNDDDFRDDLWYCFGWRDHNAYRSPMAKFLDENNKGLPAKLHNSGFSGNRLYEGEQVHHYLGGATGNDDWIPSHFMNGRLYAWVYELQELFQPKRGHYNFGDVRLFNVARKHRNDFLKYGRHTLAENIRAMLADQTDRYHAAIPAGVRLNYG